MKFSTSSFVLASLAISGSTLAAPTPPMPFDSPVPNSPKPDDWAESVRSPRIPRSPMMPALRIGGRRQSMPRFKRQDDSSAAAATPAPDGADAGDADTANAQGLLGGLGDAIDGLLHQVEGLANGLPIVGGLGILSDDGSSDPSADPASAPPSPSELQKRQFSQSNSPQPSSMPTDQTQQALAMLIQQQQQATAALHAASASLPVDPLALEQHLQLLREMQMAGLPLSSVPQSGGLNVQSLLGGLPIAGDLLSTVGGLTGGLPVVGGLLGSNGLVGGLLGGVQGDVSGLLGATGLGGLLGGVTGSADNLLGGLLGGGGGNGQSNLLGSLLGGGSGDPQAQSYHGPAHFPDTTGFYPHSLTGGAPAVPPNTPEADPTAFAFGSFAVNDAGDNVPSVPSAPPSTPAMNGASVPMDHDDPVSTVPTETASSTAPDATPSTSTPTRRRVDGDPLGEGSSQAEPDDSANGFTPSMPDDAYTPPLLAPSKRSEGPQDAVKKTLTAPRPKKMIRRRLRGYSVGF